MRGRPSGGAPRRGRRRRGVTVELHGREQTTRRMPLITIEGIDGAGKSTLATALAQRTGATLLREPGGVATSERIRDARQGPRAHRRPAHRSAALRRRARPARRRAARPAPRPGPSSSCSTASSTPPWPTRAPGAAWAIDGDRRDQPLRHAAVSTPDLTLLLRIDAATGRSRQGTRGEAADRLEREPDAFFATIAARLRRARRREPRRIKVTRRRTQPPRPSSTQALRVLTDVRHTI